MNAAARCVRAALCDLDGTLIDTAPDLAAAVNRMLAAQRNGERAGARV